MFAIANVTDMHHSNQNLKSVEIGISQEVNKIISNENYDRLLEWNGAYLRRCKGNELSVRYQHHVESSETYLESCQTSTKLFLIVHYFCNKISIIDVWLDFPFAFDVVNR